MTDLHPSVEMREQLARMLPGAIEHAIESYTHHIKHNKPSDIASSAKDDSTLKKLTPDDIFAKHHKSLAIAEEHIKGLIELCKYTKIDEKYIKAAEESLKSRAAHEYNNRPQGNVT